jgi:hypothetical protein
VYTSGTMAQANPAYYMYNNIIKPFLTSAGTWFSFVEDYQPSGPSSGSTYSTWECSGATNHSGMNWYLTFQYQTPSQSAGAVYLYVYACEVYTVAGHTWNRPVLYTTTGGSSSYSNIFFDAANGRAYTATSPNVVGTVYSLSVAGETCHQTSVTAQFSVNVLTNCVMVANADGFAFAHYDGTYGSFFYYGAFTSLITNPTLGTDFCLGSYIGATNVVGFSRDPAANGAASSYPYYTSYGNYTNNIYGSINSGTGDIYQQSGGPVATRILILKGSTTSGAAGYYRGIFPAWWLIIPTTTGPVIGDTISVTPGIFSSSDTFVYTQNGASAAGPIWVDTAA